MGLEFSPGGDPVYDFRAQEIRFDTRDTVAFDSVYLVQSLEKAQKALAGSFAVVAGIDAGKDYFLDSLGCYLARHPYTFADGQVPAGAAGVGDCTVVAVIVASVLDLEETAGTLAAAVGAEDCIGRNRFGGEAEAGKAVGDDPGLFPAAEDLPHSFDLLDLGAPQLGRAAGDYYLRVRIGAVDAADEVARFLVCGSCNRAGVDQVQIRALLVRDYLKPGGAKAPLVGGGLRVIELAAQCHQRYLSHRVMVTEEESAGPGRGGVSLVSLTVTVRNCGNSSLREEAMRAATCSIRLEGTIISRSIIRYTSWRSTVSARSSLWAARSISRVAEKSTV